VAPIRVLLVEDNPGDARLIREMLSEAGGASFQPECVDRLAAGIERVTSGGLDVVLLDLSLPDSSGLDTLHRMHAAAPEVPILVLTGYDDETVGVKAVQEGAQDYLVKGLVEGDLLVRAIRYAIERHRMLAKLEQYAHKLQSSELSFRNLIASNADGIIILDRNSIIRFVNPAAERIFGRGRDDLLNCQFQHVVQPSGRGELNVERPDGQIVPVEMHVVETEWEGDRAHLASLRDITERKQAEEALREANAQLTRWVAELERRTNEITILSEMGDLLQACVTEPEAYTVTAKTAQRLFPHYSGALFIQASPESRMTVVAEWGTPTITSRSFGVDGCLALRRKHAYVALEGSPRLVCRHVGTPPDGGYMCAPVLAQGDSLGVLYIEPGAGYHLQPPDAESGRANATQRLTMSIAEHVGLALANIRLRESLRAQAIRDPLTDLLNRRYMEESLEREVLRAIRAGTPLGVIMMDMDHLKLFNDRFGHEAGDALLRALGAYLKASVRGGDIACRYGGDEFLLILPDTCLEVARARAEELRDGAEELLPEGRHGPIGPVTLSMGVAAFPQHGKTASAVLSAADEALYRAKRQGRNQVVVAA